MTTPFPFVASQVLTAQQLNHIQNLPISDKTASYTLIAGDETKRTMMNNASATTITVNNSIFTVGDVIQVANKGAGTCTLVAGAGVTINTSGSLALAQYGGGYLLALSASTFTFFNLGGGSAYGTATGGIGAPTAVTINSVNYEYLTFNSSGTLTVTKAGFFDYLAVGGGGGANSWTYGGGGGGSGCLEIGSIYLSSNQTITIGAGGAVAAYGTLHTAGNTIIAATSPFGRTVGGNFSFTQGSNGVNQLAVGGGAGSVGDGNSAVFTTAYGKNGGDSNNAEVGGGGGGGSTTLVGGNAPSATAGGVGADGFDISVFIGGSATYKAAGGSGGGSTSGGAASLGGTAGSNNTTPANGAANSGSGGGGGNGTLTTGNGGSGICYIRFKV